MTGADPLPHPDLAARWRAGRLDARVLHLDSAAAGRSSRAVLDAVAAHLATEATSGGYVAEAAARPQLDAARAGLAQLLARDRDDVAFVESAFGALVALLDAWRLPPGSRVLLTPGEYGPNVALFRARGFVLQTAAVADEVGHLDVDALTVRLRDAPPDLVHLCVVGAHRGIVQPLVEAVAVCRAAGVPVVVDAAQAVGPVDCRVDADAVYGTSRKWLAGPRGVGFLAVAPRLAAELHPVRPATGTPAADLGSHEAFVAGRVGLGVAAAELLAAGPERVRERLHALGAATRARLDGVAGWSAVEPACEPSATTTLRPPPGTSEDEVAVVRERLLDEARILLTHAGPQRAPLESCRSTLRVSPHVDATADDLDSLAEALGRVTTAR